MAHHQTKNDRDVIVVKFTGSTYKASIDGESTTCTAGPEMAAKRLGAMVMDVAYDQVYLESLPEKRNGYYKFAISNLN